LGCGLLVLLFWDCHYDFVVFAAILKVVCEEFEELKPIALIIAEKNKKEDDGNELSRWWEKTKNTL
jgi:hypothetical protein